MSTEALSPSYRVTFVVAFRSAMTDADAARLNLLLDMAMNDHPSTAITEAVPGVARLDFSSGLFLLHGATPDDWRLEGRTWGQPLPGVVRGWQLEAADAARGLDASVPDPPAPW